MDPESIYKSVVEKDSKYVMPTYGRKPLLFTGGRDSTLIDIFGKEYIDCVSGIAVNATGYSNQKLIRAIQEQAAQLIHISNYYYNIPQANLAEKLVGLTGLSKVFFCNSGAEANEAQIKLARRYMQRVKNVDAYEIITLDKAFHGRTYATMAATGQERFQDGFAPIPDGFKTVPWGDLNVLEAAITPKTAAVLVEIVQGEGGIRPMHAEYAKGIEALCREKGILFLVDEVQGGLFRTGKPWAFQHFDLKPDAISCAKALANGLPMGAMMTTDEVSKGFVAGSHATTFGGGALTSAVAAKVVRIMKRDHLDERAASLGGEFMESIRRISESHPGTIKEVRGLGLMIGIELAFPAKAVWEELIRRGFICNLSHEVVLRLLPALNIPEEDLRAFADTLEDILANIKK